MTPEKFRQWIVILIAVSIVTVWVNMGLSLYKMKTFGPVWKTQGMVKQMPKIQKGKIPLHQVSKKEAEKSANPVPQQAK
ncbi:MAG: hypothetical protein A2Z72_07735 [Omnitrophica bacterium RBG_13_46_9]|nr:MAG: hypothetical protein A2Z72_07735 [Omnitrophica bacterium RBG_13_46_9]